MRHFGIHASHDLCEDRGGRHAALFVDVDVVSLLGIAKPQQPLKAKGRFKSAAKYSDKPRLARFRDFAGKFFVKRGLDEAMGSLIGGVVLDTKLRQRATLERDEAERRPEKRKAAADYDVHERCNVKVGALTHAITPDMPL